MPPRVEPGTSLRSLPAVLAFVLGVTGCGCPTEPPGVTESCAEIADVDQDGLYGCADPDCVDQAPCDLPWVAASELIHSSARFRPLHAEPEGWGRMYLGRSGAWHDANGDHVPDALVTVHCRSMTKLGICTGDNPEQVATVLVDGARQRTGGDVEIDIESEAVDAIELPPEQAQGIRVRGTTAVLDLDGDGAQDRVLAQPYPTEIPAIRIWWGPDPDPLLPASVASGPFQSHASVTAIGDVNGDGTEDLAATGGPLESGEVGILLGGDRPGELDRAAFDVIIETAIGPEGLDVVERAGDLTGDGHVDLMLLTVGGELFQEQTALALFSGRDLWPSQLTLEDVAVAVPVPMHPILHVTMEGLVQAGDLDGDGRTDVVVVDEMVPQAQVLGNDSVADGIAWVFPGLAEGWSPEALPQARYLSQTTHGIPGGMGSTLAIFDLDGDGDDDVIIADGKSEVPRTVALAYGVEDTADSPLRCLFHVFLGGPEVHGAAGERRFADLIVVHGEVSLDGATGSSPLMTQNNTSLRAVDDIDGDGVPDLVEHTSGSWDFTPSAADPRALLTILSGAALREAVEGS